MVEQSIHKHNYRGSTQLLIATLNKSHRIVSSDDSLFGRFRPPKSELKIETTNTTLILINEKQTVMDME